MASSSDQDSVIIYKALIDRAVPSAETLPPADNPNAESVRKLYDEALAIRETLKNFAKGDFSAPITNRGAVWGHLKALQANMQHLAWQVTQVAEGDFSQRVDFMGEFSTAFNKMTLQLEDSLERMKAQETAERTQVVLDATPLGCCLWNEQYDHLDCNLEVVKLFELNSKQEYLERFFDLMPEYQPDGQRSADLVREKLREALEQGRVQCEFIYQNLKGEPIPAEVVLVRIQQKDDYIIASYSRDLRELKRQQSELEQQRLLLLDIFTSSPICFAILVDGHVRFLSPFMTHFLGLNVGEPFGNYFTNEEQWVNLLAEVNKGSHLEWTPVTLRSNKHGEKHSAKEMLANLFATQYQGEQGIIVWLVDVTEIKRIEADLRTAKETAEYLADIKDEFIANMSHELRTPMNAILGTLYLLRSTNLSQEQAERIDTMEEAAKYLLRLIDNIFSFSKLQSGEIFIESDEFDLRELLDNLLFLLQKHADAKQLPLSLSVDDNVPAIIVGDAAKLQQILLNLTDNAIKFTSEGSVSIRVQLESSEADSVTLRFSVQDTGIGIKTENLEQLFKPFSQADGSESRKHGGIGLGLTVARKLVVAMRGKIGCESTIQQGSTFFFTMPFKLSESDKGSVIFPSTFQGMPILLAEDNKINQIVAMKLLQKKGFQVDVAANGLQAVEMVKQKKYILVLMDIQMPEMDGIQATQKIRSDAQYASLSIVALSANAMESDKRRCLEAGMNDHIAKPIDPKTLYRTILKWAKPVSGENP